jgi:hypothetical protein
MAYPALPTEPSSLEESTSKKDSLYDWLYSQNRLYYDGVLDLVDYILS